MSSNYEHMEQNTWPDDNMEVGLSDRIEIKPVYHAVNITAASVTTTTYHTGYFNASVNITSTAAGTSVPLLYNPSPSNGANNISLLPTLSLWAYDEDSDSVTVGFYNDNDELIGHDTIHFSFSENTGRASIQWDDVIATETTYEWYAIVNDHSGNSVRYPTSGFLNFTTATSYPPVITFHISDGSNFPLSDVNITCANMENQALQYAETNSQGFTTMSFNYNELGRTYKFTFKKTNYTTKVQEIQVYKREEYITMQKKAWQDTSGDDSPFDIFTIFIDYSNEHLTPVGLAMLSIVIIIVSMIAASKQFQTDFLTNVFIGVAEFGLFIAIGWLPWWLLLLPGILVSLLMGKKIADLVQGSGSGDSES
jgi:hypothetical protein